MTKNKLKKTSVTAISKDFYEKLTTANSSFNIHSVYNRVLNLKDQKNNLYSITLKNFDNLPASLKIDSLLSFKKQGITKNDQIIFNSNSIKIANKLLITFEKNKLISWSSKLKTISDLNKKNLNYNLNKSADILLEKSSFRGAAYFYLNYYFQNLEQQNGNNKENKDSYIIEEYLSEEIQNKIVQPAIEDKKPLSIIGLGMGLTPSGDDFLTGYLGVMGTIKSTYSQKNFKHFKDMILKKNISTTDISRTMILNILNLKSRAKISEFIYSVNKDFEIFNQAFKKVLTIGSTSGSDLAAGVLTAYQEILLEDKDFNQQNIKIE